ncbi:hypothetical protein [Acaryochloris sp. IP29b_bin.148]|uniref:hypothetical protein n=1 Tax=Acaryochloris sp. IP29b_bin.148 TaxID=2969218 RepID=UPI0026158E1B|nr:hypothetical protein [Acaryochloris sp. IP29b_bin.148]
MAACGAPDTSGSTDKSVTSIKDGDLSPVKDEDLSGVSFSRGLATTTTQSLIDCGRGSRVSAVGKITAEDGSEWTLPADTNFTDSPKAADLYNDCGGESRGGVDNFNLSEVVLQDAGGDEEFVAYIFADNYFELYVNGKLIAVDAVPFTPFNSSAVRFKANRPLTVAFKLVDWEENLGLGSEAGRGKAYQPGDGGLVAHFQSADGETVAITDETWKAQAFYISPLQDRSCLQAKGNVRDTSACSTEGVADGTDFSAAFWPVPDNWATPDFNDADWPSASVFSDETVGVDNKRAFTDFTSIFNDPDADAQFIWSSNLILDNLVLVRKQID